jgi:hypothetical protein
MIRSAKFTSITPKSTDVLWTDFKVVIPGFNVERPFSAQIVTNTDGTKFRMYFFFSGHWRNAPVTDTRGAIAYTWIPLLDDGSVANDQNGVITAPKLTEITLPSRTSGQQPRVVEWNRNLLVLVRGDTEFHVRMAKIGEDISLPEPGEWKTITTTWKTSPESADICFGGVTIVKPDFVNDA